MDKLGIDLGTIVFQIVNFGILVYVLNKFLYKPILKAVKAKNDEIADIEAEKAATLKLQEKAEAEREKQIKLIQKEKLELLRETRQKAEEEKKKIIETAKKEARTIIDKTKKEIEAERKTLVKNYEKDVLETSSALVEKILGANEPKLKEKLGQIRSGLLKN